MVVRLLLPPSSKWQPPKERTMRLGLIGALGIIFFATNTYAASPFTTQLQQGVSEYGHVYDGRPAGASWVPYGPYLKAASAVPGKPVS